ncbi:MAG: peptidoglycan recognition family protein [Bacillota bacterium]
MDFKIMTTSELISYIKNFNWSRKVKQLHIHHTWKPDHSYYNGTNGIALQTAMYKYHVNLNRWRDIAQHLTLLPDGQWVTGRSFNTDPASIQGWNDGAFCIEMLGNFDKGFDTLQGRQAEAMFEFCAFFVVHMKIDIRSSVKFHRDNPAVGKTCPGSGLDREWFMGQLYEKIKTLCLPIKDEEDWKLKAVDELASAGILKDPQSWKEKINEPMPVWAVLAISNEIYQKLSERIESKNHNHTD